MISGLIAGYEAILAAWASARDFFGLASVKRSFAKILIEFLTEVAVLVLVFPMLDTIVETQSKVTGLMVFVSIGIAGFCLLIAGIMAGIISKDQG